MGSVTGDPSGYLLDTHVLLWWLFNDPQLSEPAFEIIKNPENNIVVSSTVGMTSDSYNNVQVDHNLFYGNSSNLDGSLTESGSIFADPLFVDPAEQGYQLQMHSPARDAGAGIPPAPTWDINNVNRPVGSGVDIGAYEYPYWLNYLNWILK